MRLLPVTAVVLLLLSGCTAVPAPTPTPTSVPAADTCDVLSDVLTIIYNADSSYRAGRTSEQEHIGAKRIAARILSRAPVEPGSALADAVGRLQEVAPGGNIVGPGGTYDTESKAWADALEDASNACADAGSEVGVSAWTGG